MCRSLWATLRGCPVAESGNLIRCLYRMETFKWFVLWWATRPSMRVLRSESRSSERYPYRQFHSMNHYIPAGVPLGLLLASVANERSTNSGKQFAYGVSPTRIDNARGRFRQCLRNALAIQPRSSKIVASFPSANGFSGRRMATYRRMPSSPAWSPNSAIGLSDLNFTCNSPTVSPASLLPIPSTPPSPGPPTCRQISFRFSSCSNETTRVFQ